VGPLTETKAGYKWILSIIDAFTNYVTFVPLPNKEAATVTDAVFLYRSFELRADRVDPGEVTGLQTATISPGWYCTSRWWVSAFNFRFVASSNFAIWTDWCTAFCMAFLSPM
jgi:hypothetical protein